MQESVPLQENLKPPYSNIRTISIDIGSTICKIDRYAIDDSGQLSIILNSIKKNVPYHTSTNSIAGVVSDYRFFSPKQTGVFLNSLKKVWQECYDSDQKSFGKTQDNPRPITTLTGFTQSLAVIYKDKIAVLIDEPALTTDLTEDQKKILENYIGIDGVNKKISSIVKLLSLKNHPEILAQLFGEEVNFGDVKFSTMLGIAKDSLIDGNNPNIPLDDLLGFGSKSLTLDKAQQMLQELGIMDSQITIENNRLTEMESKGKFYIRNDFAGEIEVIEELVETKQISKQAVIIGLSSVGKVVITSNQLRGKFPNSKESYETQRMGANALTKWGPYLFPDRQDSEAPHYRLIDRIIREKARKKESPKYIYLPEKHDEKNIGSIYKIDGNNLIKIPPESIIGVNNEERGDIAFALAKGIFFGLREKIEAIWETNKVKNSPITIYGGLLNSQPGWIKIALQALPKTDVSYLNIPGANKTTAYLAAKSLDNEIPHIQVKPSSFIAVDFHRDEEYKQWLEYVKSLPSV